MATKSFTRKIVIHDRSAIAKLNTPKSVKSSKVTAIFSDISKNSQSSISSSQMDDILSKY